MSLLDFILSVPPPAQSHPVESWRGDAMIGIAILLVCVSTWAVYRWRTAKLMDAAMSDCELMNDREEWPPYSGLEQ